MTRSKLLVLALGLSAAAALVVLSTPERRAPAEPSAPEHVPPAERGPEEQPLLPSPPVPTPEPVPEPPSVRREAVQTVDEVAAGSAEASADAVTSRALRVLVVDAAGAPVPGVPVHVVTEYAFLPDAFQDRFAADSGPDGVAVLEELERALDLVFHTEQDTPYAPSRMGLRCGFSPGDPDVELDESWIVWLEREPAPGELLRVRCPDLGWVRVSVAGPGAADVSPRHMLRTVWVRRVDGSQSGTRGWDDLEAAPGSSLLGPFPLGWELTLRINLHGRAGQLGWIDVDGPVRTGETVEVAFEIPRSRWLSGTALRPDRTPIATERIYVHLGDPDQGGVPLASAVTDVEGRWEIGAPHDLEIAMLALEAQGQRPRPRGDALLPDPSPSGEAVDVGEVVIVPRLKPERLLVSGRVLDQDGAPLQRAWVSVHALVDGAAGEESLAVDRTNKSGAYELVSREELVTDRLSVVAGHDEHLPAEPVEAVLGSVGVDLTLVRGGSVTGEVLTDPEAHPEQIVIRIEGPGVSRKLSLAEFQWRERGSLGGLAAGTYAVRIEIRNTKWVLLETSGELPAGGELDLGPFDLRGMVKPLRLRLTDVQGAPIAKERFELVDTDLVGHRSLESAKNGSVSCLVPMGTNTFLFGNEKYGAHTIQAGPEPIELTLVE